MTVVVTGGTGLFAPVVVQTLIDRGMAPGDIVVTARDPQKVTLPVRALRADYSVAASLDAAFAGADTLLFVSSSSLGSRMDEHTNVVRAAERAGVSRILYTSVTRADTLDTVLTPEHRATEALILETGIPFVFLRNNLYTEVSVDRVLEADRTNEIVARWGDGRIASATRADMAEGAAVAVLDESLVNAALEITGDAAWSGHDLAAAAAELLGHGVTYASRTADERAIDLNQAGVPDAVAQFVIALEGDVEAYAFGGVSTTLSGLLGRPATGLVEGLRAALPATE